MFSAETWAQQGVKVRQLEIEQHSTKLVECAPMVKHTFDTPMELVM